MEHHSASEIGIKIRLIRNSRYPSRFHFPQWSRHLTNPYQGKPDAAFWRRAVSGRTATEVDPVTMVPFRIAPGDKIATAGSCFAQHISRTLASIGFSYLVTEPAPATVGAIDENYGVFPARFGNLYTTRQLLQLFQRAYGIFDPIDSEWPSSDGGFLDPFRPRIQNGGFATVDELRADRDCHLAAVRDMFELCDVLVFTLGLTEGWEAVADGAVFPLAPGTVTDRISPAAYRFHNFTVGEVDADLLQFIDLLRSVNPSVRIILTVSPVSLVATYEDRHVLVSTVYSKSVLRVAADQVMRARPDVAYFPSYEIISGVHARSQFYEDDLREVSPSGVSQVMSIFLKHYVGTGDADAIVQQEVCATGAPPDTAAMSPARASQRANVKEWQAVVCEETSLDPGQ